MVFIIQKFAIGQLQVTDLTLENVDNFTSLNTSATIL